MTPKQILMCYDLDKNLNKKINEKGPDKVMTTSCRSAFRSSSTWIPRSPLPPARQADPDQERADEFPAGKVFAGKQSERRQRGGKRRERDCPAARDAVFAAGRVVEDRHHQPHRDQAEIGLWAGSILR